MEDQNDNYTALLIETSGSEVHSQLISFLVFSGIFASCYAYKSRVKPRKKLIEKRDRKIAQKPDYRLESIKDVVGLRLVTLFRRDMPEVVERVVDLIFHANGTETNNPFVQNVFDEIVIYSTNPRYDDITHQVKEVFKQRGIPNEVVKVEQSKEGYSSIHLVSKLNRRIEELNDCSGGSYFVPAEIQIRTVFEDAWGEIDHKYGYVIRAGKDIGYPISNPEYVLGHLKVLKKFSDACAEYADIIFSEANPNIKPIKPVGQVISVAPDEALIIRLSELGISKELLEKYCGARDLKDSAKSLNDRNASINQYLQAAEEFREILGEDGYSIPNKDVLSDYLFYFYVRMSEAVCLMSTNLPDQVKAAHVLYCHLEEAYSEFPLLKLRLGQALGKLEKLDEAISKFVEADDLANTLLKTQNGKFNDFLPEADYNHLRISLPTMLGFHLWRKASLFDDNQEEKCKLLEEAIEVARSAIDSTTTGKNKQTLLNNFIYYSVDYLRTCQALFTSSSLCSSVEQDLLKCLPEMEALISIDQEKDIELLDTLAYAYYYVGEAEKALTACERVGELALQGQEEPKLDNEVKWSLLQNSYKIKSELLKSKAIHEEKA